MKKILCAVISLFLLFPPSLVSAQQVSARPHLVVNFAAMNDLDWAVPEDQWQREIKPKVEEQIESMKTVLLPADAKASAFAGESTPILTWSTLMEYMNFPMDTPSANSVYAIKMRRILEISEDLDFPVFVPLNGFQWWDQLPELYNWWDPDATHTDPNFFARQKDPEEFKARFIAGYDPDNEQNVEWQSPRTPMKLGYRNWGGGGFRLAPPPNLLSAKFQTLQQARLKVILAEIVKKKSDWEKRNKGYLFVGMSIGTEISLNASITSADEFKPYGFGSAKTLGCANQIDTCRTAVLQKYLEETSQFVNRSGIPKDQIYTHVYGETDPKDTHYALYAESAFNLYSRPGSSFYGHKDDPLASKQWGDMVKKYNQPVWGAIEYSDTPTAAGLTKTLSQAGLVDIYNWDSIKSNPQSISAIKSALATPLILDRCLSVLSKDHVQRGVTARLGSEEVQETKLPHGIYSTFTETDCSNGKKIYSQPEILYVPLAPVPDTTPKWVKWILQFLP